MDWVETQINNEDLFPVKVGTFFTAVETIVRSVEVYSVIYCTETDS